ncbi:MAG: helix-turn-helix domain-containing protein [Elusimicrobiota bacterium]|nr:helix-turn-helix domain-containing protein [Elusimicrobiota bacterium]
MYGKTHKNNIIRASNYGRAIWKCKACNHTFHIKDAKDIEIIEEVSEKVTEVITDPKSNVCCLNIKCVDYGWAEKGNIIKASNYGKNRDKIRWKCKTCGKTFSGTYDTPLYRNKIPHEKINALKKLRQDGLAIRKIAKELGLNKNTVLKWLKK